MPQTAGVYESRLDRDKMPRHVAFIMDGNGRWAARRGQPRVFGHKSGVETVREIVRMSALYGIQVITLYAFSTENWTRPAPEVKALMGLFVSSIEREIAELHANRVCVRFIGDLDALPEANRRSADLAHALTGGNTGLQLNIAVNYGGRAEIVRAARSFARDVKEGRITPEDITQEAFAARLYTAGQPDPDLVIRTAGEVRLSNLLLYQAAYAEFYAAEVCWPDFDREQYAKALLAYSERGRRFGGLENR